MAFQKGKSGNPQGRPKGSRNKSSENIRQKIVDLLDNGFNQLSNDLAEMTPTDRARFYISLLRYGVPQLQTISIDANIDNLSDYQVDEILHTIKRNNQLEQNEKR